MKKLVTRLRGITSLLATVALTIGVQGVSYGQSPVAANKIYWTEEKDLGWIQRADLDGANIESVLTTEIQTGLQMDPIFLLAVDSYENKIYWTERNWYSGKGTIRRAGQDGSNVETLVTGEETITAMALDPFGGEMYWAESNTNTNTSTILRADLDGSNVETLVAGIEAYVSGIALDAYVWAWEEIFDGVPASKMYWTEFGTGTIRRADPDGSNVETLLKGIGKPMGIALYGLFQDVHWEVDQKMYWADWDTDTIRRANLDGSNVETVITGEEGARIAFALQGSWGLIYWTESNWESNTTILRYADVDGSKVEVITEIETQLVLAVDPFINGRALYSSKWDSSTIQRLYDKPISLGIEGPGSIAVDTTDDMLYWLDKRTRSIRRANLDGTNVEELVAGLEDAKDIALDLVAGKMYWTEQSMGAIRRADLDGSKVETLLTGIENPESIALDVFEEKMYWTGRSTSLFLDSGIILRSNLDGSNVETLLTGLRDPVGIALDYVAGKMYYWIDSSWRSSMYRANLDGSDSEVVVTESTESELNGPGDIVLDIGEGKMYWANKGAGVIRRADLDGANVEEIITGLTRPLGIALYVPPPATPPPTAPISRTVVEAIVQGGAVESLTIEFARAVHAGQPDYAWSTVTDGTGHLALNIDSRSTAEVSGFYEARARNEEGEIVGRWDNILLNEGQHQILELTLDGGVRVIAVRRLGEPNPDPCSNGIAVSNPIFNRGLVEDCRALLAFRDSWDRWDRMQWSAATFIGYWTGVKVQNSRVRGFVVSKLQRPPPYISGPLSPELSRLTALEVLSLPGQNLTGPMPPELGQLSQLTMLNLSLNGLTGPMPPELGQLSQLTMLNLSWNGLTGPMPPELGQLNQLRYLDLIINRLTGPIPPELGQLTQLTGLILGSNQLTGAIPPELGQLNQLTALDLIINRLTGPIPPELGQLTQLTGLRLGSNQLTGAIPPELGQLNQLTDLRLGSNQLTGAIPPELGQLNQLTDLRLGSNQLTGAIPPELGQLNQLTDLRLGSNQLTGAIPSELGQLNQLRYLYLSDNQLTGPIPPELGQLSQLTDLRLGSNQLTGAIPPELGQLNQLRYLYLSDNQLTGPIPPELGQLNQLERVELDGNQFTCVPEALAKWADDLPVCGSTESTAIAADFDGDGATDFTDFFLFAEHFGSSDTRFDLDASGTVDFTDFFLFAEHFIPPARAKLVTMAQELLGLPNSSQLQQNAPNPFNSQTVLSYFLPAPGPVRLEVFALTGQRVALLQQGPQQAGYHRHRWDGRDNAGHRVASGMYLYRLITDEAVLTRKLMLLR